MRVLIIDSGHHASTGSCFARAFRRLGHDVRLVDQFRFFPKGASRRARVMSFASRGLSIGLLNMSIVATAAAFRPHLVFALNGSFVHRATVERVREGGALAVVFHNDCIRNSLARTPYMLDALTAWDINYTPRPITIPELRADGVRRPTYLPFAYDIDLHRPSHDDRASRHLSGDAVFIGTWAPDRGPLLEAVVDAGLGLKVYGDYWHRLPKDSSLRRVVNMGAIYGEALRTNIFEAGASLCMLRPENRDQHTMRTFEIPACEGMFVAERTPAHVEMYDEGREAIFFGSAEELVEQLRRWMPDLPGRRAIAAAGRRRLLADGHSYDDRAKAILRDVDGLR